MKTRLASKKKHRRLDVVWNEADRVWEIVETNVVVVHPNPGTTKKAAISAARTQGRYAPNDDPAQVFSHGKSGRIGKGGNAEASFRCDSKRRRG